jgi:SAM-dependent methyltransferase
MPRALICAQTGIVFHYHMVSRKEWDRLADDFEREVCDITRETKSKEIERIVLALRPSPKKSVLVDLGCGIGTFVERYGKLFRATFAVEHAPRIIARAKRRLARRVDITWLTSNIPPAAARIGACADLTVCMNVITMPQARIRQQMWEGIARVTKKKGHALIVVPSIESDRMVERVAYGTPQAQAIADAPDGLVDRGGDRQKHFAREELRALLAQHGFRMRKLLRISYPWQKEGLRKPRNAGTRRPWDWLVLAQRV